MSDAPDRAGILADSRRAAAALAKHVDGRDDGTEPAAQLNDEATELELWERAGRVLRERDTATYLQLRTMAVGLAALIDLPPEN